ncbi:MAG: threonine synthase [Omnitrophica bacterium RIFCSPHIGHO2_02_FULL_51_18]|nr:MAG: threonine synthase [Omnitrophica bacterium RIFCSPHIGHO2_02_FULL_51_18]
MIWRGIIERYKDYLPVSPKTPVVTLNEGNTPLIFSETLSQRLDVLVYLKYEGLNPTGSFKDRGMTMAISKAREEGAKAVICASTGNTSASAAAYAAKAGLKCVVLIPNGAIALGKLGQALIHNAQVLALDGNFDEALSMVKQISSQYPVKLVNSLNPYRIEGQKTGAFEICDQLGKKAPEFHAIPVGNAGNITAYWKGYKEYFGKKEVASKPVMLGFQAEGAAPIVNKKIVPEPKTIATAINIGNPASWKAAEAARDESGGVIDSVTDGEILSAYELLAKKDGVFVEPASAASVAGILKLSGQDYFKNKKGATIVCVLTGHGLKDPDRALQTVREPQRVPAKLEAIWEAIKL